MSGVFWWTLSHNKWNRHDTPGGISMTWEYLIIFFTHVIVMVRFQRLYVFDDLSFARHCKTPRWLLTLAYRQTNFNKNNKFFSISPRLQCSWLTAAFDKTRTLLFTAFIYRVQHPFHNFFSSFFFLSSHALL